MIDPRAIRTLIEKWREQAIQCDKDGDFCCAVTRENDADQLEAVLSALHETPGWQPINTAPADAYLNPVLLYWPYWTQEPVTGQREGADGTWGTEKWLGDDAKDPGPTHWMPLPAPPPPSEEAKA